MAYKVKRKIIRVGTSYGVVLPMDWVRYHGLGCDDHIEIITAEEIKIRVLKEK